MIDNVKQSSPTAPETVEQRTSRLASQRAREIRMDFELFDRTSNTFLVR